MFIYGNNKRAQLALLAENVSSRQTVGLTWSGARFAHVFYLRGIRDATWGGSMIPQLPAPRRRLYTRDTTQVSHPSWHLASTDVAKQFL